MANTLPYAAALMEKEKEGNCTICQMKYYACLLNLQILCHGKSPPHVRDVSVFVLTIHAADENICR
jgi:hypothetical protein